MSSYQLPVTMLMGVHETPEFMVPTHFQILEVFAFHEPSRIAQRLVTCNLSLVTGDLQRSGPSVSQCPVTSYQLPVTSLMGVSLRGSWSQCAPNLASGLSMNRERGQPCPRGT